MTRHTGREGRQTRYDYDPLDRVTKVTEDDTGLKRVTQYTYDGLGNVLTLTAYTDANGTGTVETTTYEYDAAGRLTKATYPDNGLAQFTYHAAGTVATRTDQKGVVTTYTYDDLHRLTNRSYNDGATPADTFAYDKASRLTGATNSVANVGFAYDDAGRIISAGQTVNSVAYSTSMQYQIDAVAHTTTRSVTYPAAATALYEAYDGRDRLNGIDYGTQALIGSSTYDLANP